jgi:hypothetical protein
LQTLVRRTAGTRLAIAAVLVIVALSGMAPPAAASESAVKAPNPERRIALGVSMLPDTNLATLDRFTHTVGRRPAIWTLWVDWATGGFPDRTVMSGLERRGVLPMVNWAPVDPNDIGSSAYRYQSIVDGSHDAYLRAFASAAAAWGGRLLIRFAFEANGPWFPWSVARFGNSAQTFKLAWRHIVRIFRAQGASNVQFVWSVYAPCSQCPPAGDLYPGDPWVDYVALDAFDWGPPYEALSMADLYSTGIRQLTRISDRPIMVTETGASADRTTKARWIRNGYPSIYRRFPRVKAIVYFNIDGLDIAEREDWRLTSPFSAMRAYRQIAADPRFQRTFKLR